MTYLPHHRSDEAATKADIARLEAATKADTADLRSSFDRLEDRFDRLEARFDRLEDIVRQQQRFYVGTTLASLTALTAACSFVVAAFG
jgi:hypothetical protein